MLYLSDNKIEDSNKLKASKYIMTRLFISISMLWMTLFSLTELNAQKGIHNILKVNDKYNELGSTFTAKNALVEDSTGVLWIGTGGGLCKYSGSTIDCFQHNPDNPNSIDKNRVNFVFLDTDHLIWTAIDDNGINVLDINGKKIYDFEYRPNVENGLLHDQVWGMWEDEEGFIWISYFYGGLSRFDKEHNQFEHFTIDSKDFLEKHRPKTVVSIIKHDNEANTYWLATTRGLVKFNTKTIEHKTFLFEKKIVRETSESQYNKTKLNPNWCRSMCKDSKGDLWLGAFGALIRFDTKSEEHEIIREVDNEILNIVPGVMTYDDNNIMISYASGLCLLDIDSRKLTVLSEVDGANPNHKLYGRMYKTKDGCTYILNRGGDKRGIYKYCPDSDIVKDYRTKHYIGAMAVTDNYIHYYRNPGQIESKHLRTNSKINYPFEFENGTMLRTMCALTGDTILVSDVYHMYMYHPDEGLTKIKELSQDNVSRHESVFMDSDGDIWNGRQRDGLFVREGNTGIVKKLNHQSEPPIVYQDYIVDFMEDDEGDIWIATEQGWTVFDKANNTTKNYLSKEVGAEHGVKIRKINAVAQSDRGVVWIGTSSNGLVQWNKGEERIVNHLNDENGLRSNRINDIKKDADNNLWIATGAGLSWVNSQTLEVKNFGVEFGILGSIYCVDINDRTIYAGHNSGYYAIPSDRLVDFKRNSPVPLITGFELYGENNDSLLHHKNGISLAHDKNFFSFTFGSINYFDPHLENYQYKLSGIDEKWVNDKGDRKTGYTNVHPGKYQFQVRVKTESENWGDPISLEVIVRPAWYQTLWFKLLVGFGLLAISWLFIKSFIKRKQRELEVDKRFAQLETMILKSQMNPHFIFNSLNSIRYLFMKDQKEKGLKYITKFARLLRTTLHHGEQALVDLKDEIELTELFIQLEQLRFDDTFTFLSRYDKSDWENVKIPPFVIQPIVENAFWHGLLASQNDIKTLEISIQKISNGYQIKIEDNGVGLNSKSQYTIDNELNKTKSYGLNIIKERFALMNKNETLHYDLSITDSTNNETGVLVIINITEQ